ncbi:MotA/TolQ/ExbB proton channel family protein [Reinekea thalattae]|uniref:MotA/TolQ/ExbB proton channel domain-containing protein n=1 Tax=Reinekea thalattae TaxID=2593301 RepID=A0A5C8Z5G8_9GAMM|nr:MotA/TolQ/ExbB proton channel family protein [Reinekea thalattae]TXR53212.1 hypothetical protein FME95_01170 [Reinekea thalattae]
MIAIFGLLLAWLALYGSLMLEGHSLAVLSDSNAALFVLGGCVASGLIHFRLTTWQLVWRLFPAIFWFQDRNQKVVAQQLVEWAQQVRRDGYVSLDAQSSQQTDEFLRFGLQLVADGVQPHSLKQSLNARIQSREAQWLLVASFFDALAYYAICIGVLGSLIDGAFYLDTSLSQGWQSLHSLITVFTPVIYGIALSTVFLKPVAGKFRSESLIHRQFESMVLDGFVAIAEGESPIVMQRRLDEY